MSDEPTSADEQPSVTSEGILQIPAVVQIQESPAAAEARDKLLAAIGAEAQHVAEKSPGQASTALEQLARAYALIATPPTSPGVLPVTTRSSLGDFVNPSPGVVAGNVVHNGPVNPLVNVNDLFGGNLSNRG
ncbi:hypothetical protein [Streptomyces sp. NPDC059979]|uniref:hypothetical protein n=1 Tax=Streptomyces sp. NPDC059979 TaxID=3347021 RepID=UPI00367C7B42